MPVGKVVFTRTVVFWGLKSRVRVSLLVGGEELMGAREKKKKRGLSREGGENGVLRRFPRVRSTPQE